MERTQFLHTPQQIFTMIIRALQIHAFISLLLLEPVQTKVCSLDLYDLNWMKDIHVQKYT